MGELTGMWKLIIYGRIDRNLEAVHMWDYIELTGMWKQIIYGRIDRNVEADYIWAN